MSRRQPPRTPSPERQRRMLGKLAIIVVVIAVCAMAIGTSLAGITPGQ